MRHQKQNAAVLQFQQTDTMLQSQQTDISWATRATPAPGCEYLTTAEKGELCEVCLSQGERKRSREVVEDLPELRLCPEHHRERQRKNACMGCGTEDVVHCSKEKRYCVACSHKYGVVVIGGKAKISGMAGRKL